MRRRATTPFSLVRYSGRAGVRAAVRSTTFEPLPPPLRRIVIPSAGRTRPESRGSGPPPLRRCPNPLRHFPPASHPLPRYTPPPCAPYAPPPSSPSSSSPPPSLNPP